MSNANGRFIWHELSTTDLDAATTFYGRIAPWSTQQFEDSTYTMWLNGGQPMGGLVPMKPELVARNMPPHWMPYVQVYDVDESARHVEALGGQIRYGPNEVPNVGCWAIIADPQGATVGLYEPDTEGPRVVATDRAGDFTWHELMTTDAAAASDFYRSLFKWEKAGESSSGPTGMYYTYGLGGEPFIGMFNKSPEMPPPSWWSYIHVDDAAKSAGDVTAAGGRVMNGPMQVPGGDWIAVCGDPQGAQFALHSTKKP